MKPKRTPLQPPLPLPPVSVHFKLPRASRDVVRLATLGAHGALQRVCAALVEGFVQELLTYDERERAGAFERVLARRSEGSTGGVGCTTHSAGAASPARRHNVGRARAKAEVEAQEVPI